MPSTTTKTIVWNNGDPTFDPPPGVVELYYGDELRLELQGFPSGAEIAAVTFWGNKVVNGQNTKDLDNVRDYWRRDGTSSLTHFEVAPDGATVVTVTDIDQPTVDDRFWYGVAGTGSSAGGTWTVDPQLVNKKG